MGGRHDSYATRSRRKVGIVLFAAITAAAAGCTADGGSAADPAEIGGEAAPNEPEAPTFTTDTQLILLPDTAGR